jgi:hypothetical protein
LGTQAIKTISMNIEGFEGDGGEETKNDKI